MGRPCKELQLSRSRLRNLEELSAEAKSLGARETHPVRLPSIFATVPFKIVDKRRRTPDSLKEYVKE
jgi:hypothetical protein